MRATVARLAGLVALAAALPATGAAQRVSAEVAAATAEHRVDIGAGTEVTSGMLVAAGVVAALGSRWTVVVEALTGRLSSDAGGADRDVGQLRGAVGFRPLSWLRGEIGVGTRVFVTPIASQRWNAASLAAEARIPFGWRRLIGVGRAAWLPLVGVTDLAAPSGAFGAAVGVEVTGSHARFALTYELERYDFPPAAGFVRREQLSVLALRAAWSPFGRR